MQVGPCRRNLFLVPKSSNILCPKRQLLVGLHPANICVEIDKSEIWHKRIGGSAAENICNIKSVQTPGAVSI